MMRGKSKTLRLMLLTAMAPLFAISPRMALAASPSIAISPGYTNIGVNGTVQYVATVTGLANTAVTWEVNEIVGGNATIGTISSTGLYTAPATVPTVGTLIVALGSDNKTMGVMYVNVEAAGPAITSISPNPVHTGNFTITLSGTGFKSGAITSSPEGNLATKFVNSTTLTVSGYQGAAGMVAFQVENPGTLFGAPFSVAFTSATPQAISPKTESLALGGTLQFTSAGATSWTATQGTISSTGLYTAPTSITGSSTVTVTATGPNGSASATVTLAPPPQTILPKTASLLLGATLQFTSAGATSWTATQGTISGTGLYTAPASTTGSSVVTVTATGANGSASATVTLVGPQVISPTSISVLLGATQQFTSAGATSWTATAGTISATGLYTAPATLPSTPAVTVTATGPGGSASAAVTLTSPQTISPTSASVPLGATQQFTSAGATSWTAVYGTVSATGLYTAPSGLSSSTDTVTAIGPQGTAAASITLIPPTPVITGAGTNGALPLGIFTATITGTGFLSNSVAFLNGVPLSTTYSGGSLSVTGFAGQPGPTNLTVGNDSAISAPFAVQVGVPNALVSPAAARRFLEQGAFGPTPTDAATVQTIGPAAWIAQQLAMPQISNYDTITSDQGGLPTHFLTNAVTNPDQLRQRVAFALSQIFVTSLDTLIWNTNMQAYQDMLLADAFGNYRQIMEDVTLSPAMGQYLNMANNAQADPSTGAVANENYARELMQLFTIGTVMLNPDGTVQVDANNIPIPTYSQFAVTEFARVYTGWTYAPAAGQPVEWNSYISAGNMVPYPAEHDSGSKQLLNGYVAPAGSTPQQDLDNALDNIFNHPNVGPFVATQLIQHLVKSNPSPAYVSRVAAVFNNDGNNVRGDMAATVTAVLLDPEARANDNGGNDLPGDGHLQEPALFIAGLVRAFAGQMNDQNYFPTDLANMGQDLFSSPSVFNYYSPSYVVPGTTMMGGEFEIFTPNNAIIRMNEVANIFSQYSNPVQSYGPGTTVDLTPFLPLAEDPPTLVSALDLTLTHGVMPTAMKSAITTAVSNESNGDLRRAQLGAYLILTSNYYNVWH